MNLIVQTLSNLDVNSRGGWVVLGFVADISRFDLLMDHMDTNNF